MCFEAFSLPSAYQNRTETHRQKSEFDLNLVVEYITLHLYINTIRIVLFNPYLIGLRGKLDREWGGCRSDTPYSHSLCNNWVKKNALIFCSTKVYI